MSEVFLSIVLPCRDQEDHIESVLKKYVESLGSLGRRYELVAVPNACTDRTAEIVRSASRAEPRIKVVDNPRGGWGLSVRTGLGAASGSVLCYTNSARTDPDQVVRLLALYLDNRPCVAKARRERRGAPLRETGSWLYNLEGRLVFGLSLRDVNGTPKILSRELYEKLALFSEHDLLDLELIVKARRLGVPIVELPVQGFKRHGGGSSTGLKSAWMMYAGVLKLRKELETFPGGATPA